MRDGIVGRWQTPATSPRALVADNPMNLKLWAVDVRTHVFEYELLSRSGFARSAENAEGFTAYHLETAPHSCGIPTATYRPIVTLIRPGVDQFREQLEFLPNYADLRSDRAAEILSQIGPLATYLGSIAFLRPERTRCTLELLFVAHRFVYYIEQRFKHALSCRRPLEYSAQVQPMILTPGHGSFPSGHSTEAFAYAYLLWQLIKASGNPAFASQVIWGEQMMRMAARMAINRTVAGVHFPTDSAAGVTLGLTLGQYVYARCTQQSSYPAWKFDGTRFKGDFNWRAQFDVASGQQKDATTDGPNPSRYVESLGPQYLNANDSSPALAFLWGEALKEWTYPTT
jgi:membrane-associated phospholipid phosphatase